MSNPECKKQRKHQSFTVETDLQDTPQSCCLDPETPGIQEITVINYKRYPVYVDVHTQSLEECVEFLDSGNHEHRKQKILPPARIGNPTQKSFQFQVSQCDDRAAKDCIRVKLWYSKRQGVPDGEKDDTIPEVYPEVGLI